MYVRFRDYCFKWKKHFQQQFVSEDSRAIFYGIFWGLVRKIYQKYPKCYSYHKIWCTCSLRSQFWYHAYLHFAQVHGICPSINAPPRPQKQTVVDNFCFIWRESCASVCVHFLPYMVCKWETLKDEFWEERTLPNEHQYYETFKRSLRAGISRKDTFWGQVIGRKARQNAKHLNGGKR